MVPGMVERDYRAAELRRHEALANARRALSDGEPRRAGTAIAFQPGSRAQLTAQRFLLRLRVNRRPFAHSTEQWPG